MCLTRVDKQTAYHEFAYKRLKRISGQFISSVRGSSFIFRKWYSAEDDNGIIQETISNCGEPYKAGFHSYIKLKDAKSMKSSDDVIAKVKVRKILHTGNEGHKPVVVSADVMLLKIVIDSEKVITDRQKQSITNKLAKYDYEKLVLKEGRKFNTASDINQKTVDIIVTAVTKDKKSFARWIVFIDAFTRQSNVFKYATTIHMELTGFGNAAKKNNDYWKLYSLVHRDKELLSLLDSRGPLALEMESHYDLQ